MMRVCLFVAACAALAQAQDAQPDNDLRPIRVAGRVTAVTGEAIHGALVRLQGVPASSFALETERPPNYSISADDNGNFEFGSVEPGRYTLISEKAGFVTHPYGARSDADPASELVLETGMEFKELSLRMTPLGVLYGRVMDQDGHPVAKAQMNVYRSVSVGGKLQLISAGVYDGLGASDEQGDYRVRYLPTGRYYVKATPWGGPTIRIQDRVGPASQTMSVATFYPNVADAAAATPVDVEAGGEVRGVDIHVQQERVYSIRGKAIIAATGDPAPGVTLLEVVSVPGSTNSVITSALLGSAKTGPDGSFEMRNLMPGRHTLQVLAMSVTFTSSGGTDTILGFGSGATQELRASGRADVTITDSDVNGVVLQLISGTALAGTVKLEGGDLKEWHPQPTGFPGSVQQP